eukprot:SAG22_NODE_2541_length_2462_cov_29.806602_3_plen_53_part_00
MSAEQEDHDQVFAIEVLLAQRRRGGVPEYLVRWEGYGPDADSNTACHISEKA